MKKIYLFVLFLFTVCTINAQTQHVRFNNNTFYVNGSPFFPIGWYDCYTDAEMDAVHGNGANVVLPYMNFLYLNDPSITNDTIPPTINWYIKRLKDYLSHANSLGMKVIIQVPCYYYHNPSKEDYKISIVDTSWAAPLVRNFGDNPALLGWYIADEPEYNETIQPYLVLQNIYFYINAHDRDNSSAEPNHPCFLACGNGYELENYRIRHENSGEKQPNWSFYDVLMQDHYILWQGDPVPSPNIYLFDDYTHGLVNCYESDITKTKYNGSTMIIAQAYGNNQPSADGPMLRDPAPIEIKYESFSYLYIAQSSSFWDPQCVNPGGIMYWRYGASSTQCRTDINKFIKYFTDNRFDKIMASGYYANGMVNCSNPSSVKTFARSYNDTLYIFAINQTNNAQNVSYDLNLGSYTRCDEIDDLGNIILTPLTPIGSGHYQLRDYSLGARKVKIYRIIGAVRLPKTGKGSEIVDAGTFIKEFSLKQNFPNPFNPTTQIEYSISNTAHVTLKIFNILGKEITTLVDETKEPGLYNVNFNANNLPSGVYIYQIKAGEFISSKQMLLMK